LKLWPRKTKQAREQELAQDLAQRERERIQQLARLDTRSELEHYRGRLVWLLLFFFTPFLIFVGRLWQLQILQAEPMAARARSNLVRTVELPADRGLIMDAQRRPVAENRVAYDVILDPIQLKKHPESLPRLRDYLNLSQRDMGSIERQVERAAGQTIIARRDISRDQVALLETHRLYLPGVEVRIRAHRHYPFNELGAHMLGFMNEIRAEELEELEELGYRPGDYVGRSGLERAYEAVLRGSPGLERQVVDAHGLSQGEEEAQELLGDYRRVEPIPGRNLVLTVNMDLQELMVEAFSNNASGAAVAIDPRDGSVLGLFSKPTFNPNSWTGRLSAEEKRRADEDLFKPMLDKTVQSHFPGSTFKLVSAYASVKEGWIEPDETLRCPGFYEFGKRRFHCWHRAGHGSVDLIESLKYSCDVYYYKLGEKLGMDTLARYAYLFGFGEKTGVGINSEQRGLVPTRDWHRKNSPEGFQHGLTLSTAVGQGDTRVTPLQMAMAYGALANKGKLYYPRLVDRIENAEGAALFQYPARVRREIEDARLLQEIEVGMGAVVNETHGTAYSHRLPYMNVVGKTGTAQVRGFSSQRLSNGEIELRHRDHSWFVGYAPMEAPELVVVVFVEHGGSGSKVAAPVAMKIIDRYFRDIKGVDPEARRALYARQQIGPRRLRRSRLEGDEEPRWERPGQGEPSDPGLMGATVSPDEAPRPEQSDETSPGDPEGSPSPPPGGP
jgi:penicillin-binding protein 2